MEGRGEYETHATTARVCDSIGMSKDGALLDLHTTKQRTFKVHTRARLSRDFWVYDGIDHTFDAFINMVHTVSVLLSNLFLKAFCFFLCLF